MIYFRNYVRHIVVFVTTAVLVFGTLMLMELINDLSVPSSGTMSIGPELILQHVPGTAYAVGRSVSLLQWTSPVEPLLWQYWILDWLLRHGEVTIQASVLTALFALIVTDLVLKSGRQKQPMQDSQCDPTRYSRSTVAAITPAVTQTLWALLPWLAYLPLLLFQMLGYLLVGQIQNPWFIGFLITACLLHAFGVRYFKRQSNRYISVPLLLVCSYPLVMSPFVLQLIFCFR